MNILVVYAHHEPSSLTGALKNAALSTLSALGHTVVESDLYSSGFHPVANKYDFTTLSGKHFNYMLEQKASSGSWAYAPDITSELQKVNDAELILFYAPVWWASVPAILKGWFDRVLVMGVSWDGGRVYEDGLYRGKKAMLTAVAGGPEDYYQPLGKHKATLKQILHPINHGTLAFCGMDVIEPYFVYGSLNKTPEEYTATIDAHRASVEAAVTSPRYLSRY
jgi:NAD(P)H dehydrogenase (quinone)